ncbi:MAG: signal peptidase I [Rhodospirillales bacterium]
MSDKSSGGARETIITVIYAIVIALVIRTFAYEPFNIPSGSMFPTLLIGDYLFVSKASYGYSKHSLPGSAPIVSDRIFFEDPERGDVAVFKTPSDNTTDYIKRIIGLPGDKIQVVGGILNINGKPVERQFVDLHISYERGRPIQQSRYLETLPNGVKHYILESGDDFQADNTEVYSVPKESYFMMGDNRDHSNDSRFPDVGFVPKVNLVGRAEFLFFSIDGSAWRLWEWPANLRFKRFFTGIN